MNLFEQLERLKRSRDNIAEEIERIRRCCDKVAPNWQPLPVEGATLASCFIDSHGKRGTMHLLTREFPPLSIALDHSVLFKGLDGVEQRFLSLDDSSVGLIINPLPGQTVRLVEARVDFFMTNEDPAVFLAAPTDGKPWDPQAVFDVALQFGVTPR